MGIAEIDCRVLDTCSSTYNRGDANSGTVMGIANIGWRVLDANGKMAIGWKATLGRNYETLAAIHATEVTLWERCCAVAPPSATKEPKGLTKLDSPKREREVAWEDDGSLQWNMRLTKEVRVGGFVGVQTEGFVTGPQD